MPPRIFSGRVQPRRIRHEVNAGLPLDPINGPYELPEVVWTLEILVRQHECNKFRHGPVNPWARP